MPTLNWIGKEAVVKHDKEVPFKLLRKVKVNSVGKNSQNLIIHGDNLEALKALMPHYVGKIKCIYIDPPYNTGNEKWVYNDKVNSLKIQKWIGKVVGSESEDLSRHDKWLCMMYPRLKMLKDLLSEDGIMFISIDSHEDAHLKMLCYEFFGKDNVETYIWNLSDFTESSFTKTASNTVRSEHEYIMACYKGEKRLSRYKEYRFSERDDFGNSDSDSRGDWMSGNISRNGIKTTTGSKYYTITTPSGNKYTRNWTLSKDEFNKLLKDNRIFFSRNGEGVPRLKIFKSEPSFSIQSSIFSGVKTSITGKNQVKDLFNDNQVFDFPKPTTLIKRLIEISTKEDDIILDSFAGSGTTAHAVLDLNKDGKNRKFILVEMEDKIAKDITAERVKRAIEKYNYKDGFEFCELGKPLFDENGQIEESCDFEQFATYIYFTETQTNIDKKKIKGNFIGDYDNTEYYLVYKEKFKNFLNKSILKKLKKNKNKKIIYADYCDLTDEELEEYNIQFKQIPYEVKVY